MDERNHRMASLFVNRLLKIMGATPMPPAPAPGTQPPKMMLFVPPAANEPTSIFGQKLPPAQAESAPPASTLPTLPPLPPIDLPDPQLADPTYEPPPLTLPEPIVRLPEIDLPPPVAPDAAAAPGATLTITDHQRPAGQPETAHAYRVRTAKGAFLVRLPSGQLGAAAAWDPANGVLAIVPDAYPQCCFLICANLEPLRIAADGSTSNVVSSYLIRPGTDPVYLLRHPRAPAFLGTKTPDGQALPDIHFSATTPSVETAFVFRPAEEADIPAALGLLVADIARNASRPLLGQALISALRHQRLNPCLFEGFVRLLPTDELDALALWFAQCPTDRALAADAMPHDIFLTEVLADLATWRETRAPIPDHMTQAPVAHDDAVRFNWHATELTPGQCMVALLRGRTEPRKNLCILATVSNEGMYLLEWIAYHKSIGVDHIFIYTNDNLDDSDALLGALARAGEITLIQNQRSPAISPQLRAYGHALMRLPQMLDYRWSMVIDIDEFFVFNTKLFRSAADVIAFHETQDVDAIAFNWLLFRADRDMTWAPGPVIQRFQRRIDTIDHHVKTMFRTQKFWSSQPHFPNSAMARPFIYRTEKGDLHYHHGVTGRSASHAAAPSADYAWLNHYQIRTLPEALWKLFRGDSLHGTGAGVYDPKMAEFIARQFFAFADHGSITQDRRIIDCAAGYEAERKRLMALPDVAPAQQRIRQGWVGRLTKVTENFVNMKPVPDEPPPVAQLRDIARQYHLKRAGASA